MTLISTESRKVSERKAVMIRIKRDTLAEIESGLHQKSESIFRTPAQIATAALRAKCVELLAQCTAEQRELFAKLFPGGIDEQTDEKLGDVIRLCRQTLSAAKKGEE